jgi:hypothetical protein
VSGRRRLFLVVAGLAGCTGTPRAQAIGIWPGPAPGSEHWTQKEKIFEHTPVGTVVMNVVTPTLTPYLPERSKATGTAVIIAPGGAFVALTVGLEGSEAAEWLRARGIAAFLLKYVRSRSCRRESQRWTWIPPGDTASPTASRLSR